MSKCIYCGEKAGLFNSRHRECEDKYLTTKINIIELVSSSIEKGIDFKQLQSEVEKLANEGLVNAEEVEDLYISGYDTTVGNFLDDGILTKDEEEKLAEFKKNLNFDQGTLDKNGSFQKIVKAVIIRDISEWKLPAVSFDIVWHLPFNFQKDEKLVWLFQNVEFYELRTRTEYQGGSVGASVRVAKGFYIRTSSFKWHPVQTEEMRYIDTGTFAITDKQIYFVSSLKSFRIEFWKIITMTPYEDGISLQKDGVSAKPQIFKNLDGWFAYNVISNLNTK